MKSWFGQMRIVPRRARKSPLASCRIGLEILEERCLLSAANVFLQTNLVSDVPGLAVNPPDPNLVNPWGLTAGPTTPFWVADNGTGVSTLYNGLGGPIPLTVNIPSATPGTHGTPTGTVFNTSHTGFDVSVTNALGQTFSGSSVFLFATLDGTISGWDPSINKNSAIVEVNMPGAVFTGLAIGTDSKGQTLLYAADVAHGTIDVFDQNFKQVTTLPGSFHDPKVPGNASPFNIQNINGQLYVEYTQGPPGAGHGFLDVFNTEGQVVPNHLIHNSHLDNPWGVALAPSNFGGFSNDLLVGNFGDGHINAFDPTSGKFLGELMTSTGQPFEEDHLWSLRFGNGSDSANTNTLYFTAGIQNEKHGLFGSLQAVPALSANKPLLPNLAKAPEQTIPTLGANGDQNPYGVAFVPQDVKSGGELQAGDILVSDFNNGDNVQGTGSTIVRISPDGQQSVFFQGGPGIGLTTALGVLKSGFVIVGDTPTNAAGVAQPGELVILDSNGNVVNQIIDSAMVNGPWDLAINDQGTTAQVFVSNVLSGTVVRLNFDIPKGGTPDLISETRIASGYAHRTDPNALVVGPTGLAYDPAKDILYVASTADNAIYAIAHASVVGTDNGKGKVIVASNNTHLHGPLGLALAPNGDLIVANGDAVNQDPKNLNTLVEFTPQGKFVSSVQIDNGPAGAAFGLAVSDVNGQVRFAAVDDNTNTLQLWTFQ